MHDGSIELMVHRRTLHDDRQGVGEPLNETAYGTGLVVRGRHFLLLESPMFSAARHRPLGQHLFMSPLSTYALPTMSFANYSTQFRQTWSALNESIPANVHLLTLDQWAANVFLVRVEHYFEQNEDETYSKPAEIDLQVLFNALGEIREIVELALGGNFPLSDMHRLTWMTDERSASRQKPTGTKVITRGTTLLFHLCRTVGSDKHEHFAESNGDSHFPSDTEVDHARLFLRSHSNKTHPAVRTSLRVTAVRFTFLLFHEKRDVLRSLSTTPHDSSRRAFVLYIRR